MAGLGGSLGGQVRGSAPASPTAVLGSDLAAHLRVEDWTAASWPDVTGNLTLAQATGAKRFTATAGGVFGQPSVLSDGVDDTMVGTMANPILSGTRPYAWSLTRYAATAGDPTLWMLTSADTAVLTFYDFITAGVTYWYKERSGVYGGAVGPAADTKAHVREQNWSATAADQFKQDGVPYTALPPGTSAVTEATAADTARVEVAAFSGGNRANAHYRDIIIARACTAAQRAAIYRYLQYRLAGV